MFDYDVIFRVEFLALIKIFGWKSSVNNSKFELLTIEKGSRDSGKTWTVGKNEMYA